MPAATNVRKKGCCRNGEDTGEEISCPAVTASSGGGVWSVGTDHVVDGGHVDAVIGNTNDCGEYHGPDPLQHLLTLSSYVTWGRRLT